MPEAISLCFTYRRNEYVRAMRRHYQRTLHVPRDLVAAAFAIVAGCYVAYSYSGALGTIGLVLAVVAALLLAIVGYGLLILPAVVYSSQPTLKQQYDLVFSDEGIAFRTAGIDAKLDWSIYRGWLADDEFYVLYHGKRGISVIPRRAFANDSVDRAFCELLSRKIEGAKVR